MKKRLVCTCQPLLLGHIHRGRGDDPKCPIINYSSACPIASHRSKATAVTFDAHLKHASEVVYKWPAWKQTLLGGSVAKCSPSVQRLVDRLPAKCKPRKRISYARNRIAFDVVSTIARRICKRLDLDDSGHTFWIIRGDVDQAWKGGVYQGNRAGLKGVRL